MISERVLEWLMRVTPTRPWSIARRAIFTLTVVVAAFLLRLALSPLLGGGAPYSVFLISTVMIGFFCGGLFAAVAAIVSTLLAIVFFVSPDRSLALEPDQVSTAWVFLFLVGVLTGATVLLRAALVALQVRQHALAASEANARQVADLSPQIVWAARPSGKLDYYNSRWFEYSGADPATIQADWSPYVHPEDIDLSRERWAHALATGENYEVEFRLRRADGEYRWFLARALPFRDPTGRIVRWFGSCTDIHDTKTAFALTQKMQFELAQSEGRFRQIADLLPQIVWSTLPDGHHDYYNQRWYEFTGVPEGSTDGEGWNGMFHAEDQPRAWEKWNHSLATGDPYEIEYRLRRADGQYRWVLGRALALRDENGQIVRWFGTCTDIHDRKMALAMQETLSHELSHRIKNIFAVVTSLVSLSMRNRPEVQPFALELRKRLNSLGRAHDFARPHSDDSRPNTPEPTIFALVRVLMEPYAIDTTDRLTISGEDMEIADRVATPIALIVHELATNATKYGALSVPEGKVIITGERAGNTYELVWCERGGPPVTAPGGTLGFGSRLLDVSAAGQLGGEVLRAWDADGVCVTIRVPVSAIERAPDSPV